MGKTVPFPRGRQLLCPAGAADVGCGSSSPSPLLASTDECSSPCTSLLLLHTWLPGFLFGCCFWAQLQEGSAPTQAQLGKHNGKTKARSLGIWAFSAPFPFPMLSFPPSEMLLKGGHCGCGCCHRHGAWMSLAAASSGSGISKGPSLSSSHRDNISSKHVFPSNQWRPGVTLPLKQLALPDPCSYSKSQRRCWTSWSKCKRDRAYQGLLNF